MARTLRQQLLAVYGGLERSLRDPSELERFDPCAFYEKHLIERLSGVGTFAQRTVWATPPTWTDRST